MKKTHLTGLALVVAACTVSATDRLPPTLTLSRAAMEHGVKLGQAVPQRDLSCSDSTVRRVAAPGAVQMITFATPYDCALCSLHLSSLGSIHWNQLPKIDPFIVAWGPSAKELVRLESGVKDTPGLTFPSVCIDREGVFWDSLNVSHTPFTAIVRDGRVIYLHDGVLSSPALGDQFYEDVARLLPEEASDTPP